MTPIPTQRLPRCVMCKGKTRQGLTELRYEFGNLTIIVQDVPAEICEECGEEYIDGPLGTLIGDAVAQLAEQISEIIDKQDAFTGGTFQTRIAQEKLVPASR